MSPRTTALTKAIGILLAAPAFTVLAQGANGWIPFGASSQQPSTLNPPATAASSGSSSSSINNSDSGKVRLIDLPRLDNRAIEEVISGLMTRLELEKGYGLATSELSRRLVIPSKVTPVGAVLERSNGAQSTLLFRFGYLRQAGQLPQLWYQAIHVDAAGEKANPDASLIDSALAAILKSRETHAADIDATELKVEVIKLAYVDSESALAILKSMGVNVGGGDLAQRNNQTGQNNWSSSLGSGIPSVSADQVQTRRTSLLGKINNSDLPIVIRTPAPNPQDVGLVGGGEGSSSGGGTGPGGFTTLLGATNKLATETLSSPTTQLMVMYNPNQPEQLGRIRQIISEVIDTPARQIVIEAMVLEITSNGLDELGLQWNQQKGFNALTFGALTPGAASSSLSFARDTSNPEFIKSFYIKLDALTRNGKAEVLARPSVLTLDNRQATIRVGTDIPIATSRDSSAPNDSRVSYSFFYLPTGIQLNVRPRIDNEAKAVSMQIDAVVSATIANLGAEIRSPGQVILAAAPAVSTRRVQTYARIPNNTPLIIGGLISRNSDVVADKTPFIGDIPVIGSLFQAKRATQSRQEVIIVLTPYIIDHAGLGEHHSLPKDAPSFDFKLDTHLFRSMLRLRAEDIPNSAYIRDNARLALYRKMGSRISALNPAQTAKPPLSKIMDKRIPGDQAFAVGAMGEVLKNRYAGVPVSASKMMLFNQRDKGELVTSRLSSILAKLGDGVNPSSFFQQQPNKCLAITFILHRQQIQSGNVMEEPEPSLSVVDCKSDRSDWKSVLYELNRKTKDAEVNTILIKDDSDILLLSRAIELRRVMQINTGSSALTIENMAVGRVVALPEFGPEQIHLLDAVVARNFYLLQHSLRAFEEDFESTMSEVDELLRRSEFRHLFSAEEQSALFR